jgi:two-component system, cell cycle response regulator
MSNPHKIALVGFSSFERATFESFFRLAARRPPGYVLVPTPAEANLAVVNADDPITMAAALDKKPCKQVMLIGSSDGGTGWTLQRRPLNLMKVLTNVEQLLSPVAGVAPFAAPRAALPTSVPAARAAGAPGGLFTTRPFAQTDRTQFNPLGAAAPVSRPPGLAPHVPAPLPQRPAPALAPALPVARAASLPGHSMRPFSRQPEVRAGSGDHSHSQSGAGVLGGISQSAAVTEDSNVDHILVVDDSDIALKFMRNRLTRFGFRTDLANSGEEALGRLGVRPYKFVFLDVMMEGLDGYQTCRAIKQRKYGDEKPPIVVMLTSRGGTIDKIRGTLAGCDAYLTKPLNERDLIAILSKHDRSVARSFQSTNFGGSVRPGFKPATTTTART